MNFFPIKFSHLFTAPYYIATKRYSDCKSDKKRESHLKEVSIVRPNNLTSSSCSQQSCSLPVYNYTARINGRETYIIVNYFVKRFILNPGK